MTHTPELNKALSELKRITGDVLDISPSAGGDADVALEQIRSLLAAYKEKYNKTHFLQGLLTGTLPAIDRSSQAKRLHIEPDEPRILLLIETKVSSDYDTVMEVLKNLFPSRLKTHLIPISEQQIAILKPAKSTSEDLDALCRTIVDTLSTEALVSAVIAYSNTIFSLHELSAAFRENALALRIGKLFFADQEIFTHTRLGVGRLIYELPLSVCEDFLKEIFGNEVPDTFEEETIHVIHTFIQNNLNIAETARQLHMHRNTLIYRLEQMEERTGLNLRTFEDAMTFKVATMVMAFRRSKVD